MPGIHATHRLRGRRRSVLISLLLGLVASPSVAQPGPAAPSVTIGGAQVILPVKAGDCALERSHPTDKRVIEGVEGLIAGHNQLHLSVTGCADRTAWRDGKLANLKDYMQVQSGRVLQGQNFAGQEKAAIAANCNGIRQQGSAILNSVSDTIKQKLVQAQKQAMIQNMSLLGALDEDDSGCYIGMVIKGQTEQGQQKSQLCIFAITVLNGKLVYLYHYSDKLDETEVERLLVERKATAKAYVEANGGHKK